MIFADPQDSLQRRPVTNLSSKSGMYNIRPVGQIWPSKTLNVVRKAQNLVYLACFFYKNILSVMSVLAHKHSKKNFWPAKRIELCTPALNRGSPIPGSRVACGLRNVLVRPALNAKNETFWLNIDSRTVICHLKTECLLTVLYLFLKLIKVFTGLTNQKFSKKTEENKKAFYFPINHWTIFIWSDPNKYSSIT